MSNLSIANFSQHLFWDVKKDNLDLEINASYIVKQVLDYGLLEDWKLIRKIYGLNRISEIATNLRDLNIRSATFIASLTDIPISQFKCSTISQSKDPHWNF